MGRILCGSMAIAKKVKGVLNNDQNAVFLCAAFWSGVFLWVFSKNLWETSKLFLKGSRSA